MNGHLGLLQVLLLRLDGLTHGGPGRIQAVDRGQTVEDAVAAEDNEVVLLFVDGELGDFGLCDDHALLAAQALVLGLDIAKGSGDAEATREHSIGAVEHLARLTGHLAELVRYWDCLVGLSLVYLTTVVLDSVEFVLFVGTVVL